MNKVLKILSTAAPVALMVGLIPLVSSDYALACIYLLIAIISFTIRREEHDYLAYAFGLIVLTISEYFFIKMGVETFARNSLFGIMPIWLPFLWAYGFVALKRSLKILSS